MFGAGRAVHEIPRIQRPLFSLDQKQTLTGEDEKVLLRILAVVPAPRLTGLEHRNRVAELRKRYVVSLEDAGAAEDGICHPRGVANVDDEPSVRDRDVSCV